MFYRGQICFWDSKLGTISESIKALRADVLCLALAKDQKTLYTSGVDPTIVQVTADMYFIKYIIKYKCLVPISLITIFSLDESLQ